MLIPIIFAAPKYYHWSKIHIHNDNGEWYSQAHGQLSLEWKPHDLVYFHESDCGGASTNMCNATDPTDMFVDITMIGYKEEINVNGTLQVIYFYIIKL